MSPDQHLHERLTHIEEKFDIRFNQMADAITKLADHMGKLSERVSDMSLLNERSNQHSESIKQLHQYDDQLDARVDEIEKMMPLIKRFMDRSDKVSLAVTILLITGIVGSFFAFA